MKLKRPVKSTGNKSYLPKLRFNAQDKTETCTISLFDSKILFCERAGSVGDNAIKHYLKRLWLVAIATILSKTFKINFLFTSAIAHNWSFFTKLKQTFWSIYRVPFHLNQIKKILLQVSPQNKPYYFSGKNFWCQVHYGIWKNSTLKHISMFREP